MYKCIDICTLYAKGWLTRRFPVQCLWDQTVSEGNTHGVRFAGGGGGGGAGNKPTSMEARADDEHGPTKAAGDWVSKMVLWLRGARLRLSDPGPDRWLVPFETKVTKTCIRLGWSETYLLVYWHMSWSWWILIHSFIFTFMLKFVCILDWHWKCGQFRLHFNRIYFMCTPPLPLRKHQFRDMWWPQAPPSCRAKEKLRENSGQKKSVTRDSTKQSSQCKRKGGELNCMT